MAAVNKPFRFQACWMSHEKFKEFVEENWPNEGVFPTRLEELSTKLQDWNKQVFGNIFRQKRELKARIEGCQRELSKQRIRYLIKLEARLRRELDEVLDREEALWYKKSRMEFIKDGDRNTSYFHQPEDFEDKLPWNLFQDFSSKDWVWLTKPFSIAEIEKAINNMGALKAPGPDGYQALFYRKNWDTVADSLCLMVIKALEGKGIPEGLNDTHLVLIPKDMGFPVLLVDVVMECVTTTRMQILWNGEPTEQFTPSRGVRQGDPLSSYLFVMCLEKLQQAIDLEVRNKNWRPITIGRNGPRVTNLFFADDMVLFGEANGEQALVMKYVLDNFCEALGEKISVTKSRVFFSSNTDEGTRHKASSAFRFEETEDLGTYLGMPTINGRVTRHTFEHLEDKINTRLAGWSTKKLSLAGRETLVKSTLLTMANYSMQTAKIPRTICDSIDRKARRFLWGGDETKKSIHLINWETVQQPKSHGGLGIVSARQANAAFLTKLGWRVLAEPQSLWSRVLQAKYCNNRCDIDIFQPKSNMSNVWAGISSQSKTIVRGTATAVGNGRRTLFWDHAWVDGVCLSDNVLAPIPENILGAIVSEMWCEFNGWKWDLFADYLPQDLLLKIASISLVNDPSLDDSLYWQGSSSGKFTIKFALGYLKGIDYDQLPEPPVWRTIWRLPVQQRARVFLWLAAHGRLMAELLALLAGLERAKSLNIPKLLINMDNSPYVNLINEDQLVSNGLKFIVKRCQELIRGGQWRVKLEHTFREANKVIDTAVTSKDGATATKCRIFMVDIEVRWAMVIEDLVNGDDVEV
ncbi:uncharacterized protein LOC141628922 [Silene latifolia]|uniref:uncharacterized protein LOC141628922 n=1 Tax=Silene latifolia TaxID=37657 RepID=UPI003D775637